MLKHIPALISLSIFALLFTPRALAAPSISQVQTNSASYPNNQIPRYSKFEITFQIGNSTATNTLFPYDANAPSGLMDGTGITVNAIFTDPLGTTYSQPAFYYQNYVDEVKNNREWFYPQNTYSWKVRFSPHMVGGWSFRLTATDASGSITSQSSNFTVVDSPSHGFIKVSSQDKRYFEYDDGTYFPALGFNLNGGDLDNVNPVLGNTSEFSNMGPNGAQLSRIWVSQFSIFGEGWGKWGDHNPAHFTHQEPRLGIVNPMNFQLSSWYPSFTPPTPPSGSEYYLWLDYDTYLDTDPAAHNLYPRFTPCRYFTNIAVKQNTNYRVRVRFREYNIEGPKVAGQPYGFTVKSSPTALFNLEETIDEISKCNNPALGTVVAATYNSGSVTPDSANPGWSFLEGTFNNAGSDFLGHLYLTFNNVADQTGDGQAGKVFVDHVWLEEATCTSNCPNLIYKPWMSMHYYINQRDAYSFDKVLNLAEQYGLYLKAVMLEKNDRIFQTIDANGQLTANQNIDNFYGNGTTVNKVRWLQQAWWRYMQGRWGYSPYIHSWELLNEGNPSSNHYVLTDEFGKFMKCRVFGQVPTDLPSDNPDMGVSCRYDHPNSHLVSTSFYGSLYPWQFWNNGGSAAGYKLYRDVDYADQHKYADEQFAPPSEFYDSAQFAYALSTVPGLWAPTSANTLKPFIRGEAGWGFSLPRTSVNNPFSQNEENGEWLHDYIWAGINNGGLMEQYFAGGYFTDHIYNIPKTGISFDHRPVFKTFYNFIKDVPLNNGHYTDALASASLADLRVWGQKDLVNKRAHLWIANINHTWYNVMGGYVDEGGPPPVTIVPLTGSVTVSGFTPNTVYPIQWWNTYSGQPDSSQGDPDSTITSDSAGGLTLNVTNLSSDAAVKIGDYSQAESVIGDMDADEDVDLADQIAFFPFFGSTNALADFNDSGRVDIFDYSILVRTYGTTP